MIKTAVRVGFLSIQEVTWNLIDFQRNAAGIEEKYQNWSKSAAQSFKQTFPKFEVAQSLLLLLPLSHLRDQPPLMLSTFSCRAWLCAFTFHSYDDFSSWGVVKIGIQYYRPLIKIICRTAKHRTTSIPSEKSFLSCSL